MESITSLDTATGPSPLSQYLSQPQKKMFTDDDAENEPAAGEEGEADSRRGSLALSGAPLRDVFEDGAHDDDDGSLVTPVDFNSVFSSELFAMGGGGGGGGGGGDDDSTLPSLTPRTIDSSASGGRDLSSRGSIGGGGGGGVSSSRRGSSASSVGGGGGGFSSRPSSRDKIRPASRERRRPGSRERNSRRGGGGGGGGGGRVSSGSAAAGGVEWTTQSGRSRAGRASVPGTQESFYGRQARQEFFELFHDHRARTPEGGTAGRHGSRGDKKVPPLRSGGAATGRPGSSSSAQGGRPSSRQKSARSTYLKRCHEPLQLVPVSVRDVAQPSKSFEVAVDSVGQKILCFCVML